MRDEAGRILWMKHRRRPQAAANRQVLVLRGFDEEESLHLLELLRVRRRKIVSLAPVLVDVVEFPLVRERRPLLDALWHTAHPRLARTGGARKPAVVVNSAAGHDVEELRLRVPRGLCVGKGVDHADAIDRILLEPVHHARRGDLRQFVDRRHDVDDVVELRPGRRIGLDAVRPGDGHRLAGAAEIGAHQLGALVGRAARPGPAGVVHVVGLRTAEGIEAARVHSAPRCAARSWSEFRSARAAR